MTVYTDEQAREKLDVVLRDAMTSGEVRIRSRDGEEFLVRPVREAKSPLDVGSIELDPPMTAAEIVGIVRQGRERQYR